MSTHIYSIYKATNLVNGKCYIGYTNNIHKRIIDHKSASENKNHKGYDSRFYKAIRKHGWDNFEWEVIYQSLNGDHCLNTMEPYFIKYYNSYKKGYNSTVGGYSQIGYKHSPETIEKIRKGKTNPSEETRRKMSQWQIGKKYSKERCDNISASLKGKISPNKGKKHSEESKKRMSLSQKEYFTTHESPFKGKKHSEETKQKMRFAKKKRV